MIALYKKLEAEGLLKKGGRLLDLGCGNGKISEPFLRFGYEGTLVDKNPEVLELAKKLIATDGEGSVKFLEGSAEDFKFEEKYDGIILSNVLPFIPDHESIEQIVNSAFDSLNENGFLYFTLFGERDEWNIDKRPGMTFYKKENAEALLNIEPYYISADYGRGTTMKGGLKTWHIFSFLYIKK